MDYYRNLRVTNPSNYLYFYDFGDYQIIGASPESLVSVKKGEVTTNPIAGTRPRGATEEEDQALAHELLHDIKETAEHRMLVDLILKNQKAYVQAGAGIVYDSIPENEFYETINKAKSMTRIGDVQ